MTEEKTDITTEGSKLYVNGVQIFQVPDQNHTRTNITFVGSLRNVRENKHEWANEFSQLYVGTGECCHGHLYLIEDHTQKDEEGNRYSVLGLENIITANTNVFDVIPLRLADSKPTGAQNPHSSVLIAGSGCSGSGITIVDTYAPSIVEIMGETEYRQMLKSVEDSGFGKPKFNATPNGITMTVTGHYFNRQKEIDITTKLIQKGVDIDKTIELLQNYKRW